jgi:hypothetical protein
MPVSAGGSLNVACPTFLLLASGVEDVNGLSPMVQGNRVKECVTTE